MFLKKENQLKNSIQKIYHDFMNSKPGGVPVRPFLTTSLSSWACASLTKRMWTSANQLAEDPLAREQVFHAIQRIYTSAVIEKKEFYVGNFALTNRVGAIAVGLLSIKFAMRAIGILRNRDKQDTK
jgi:hypothetical protein